MAKLIVTSDHDYRWPSGCITAYKADKAVLTVKAEVLADAVEGGWGKEPASGGAVAKRVYLTDEKGAESFAPSKSSAITPMGGAK